MSSYNKSKKQNNLVFIQKCIILSNISQEKDKLLLNSFDFMPIVKLYTSTQNQKIFTYTKVKGALFILKSKTNAKKKNYWIRIYDSRDYSLALNLEINEATKKSYIKVEPNFYCFTLKLGFIGFQFVSKEEAEFFYNLLMNEPNEHNLVEYEQIDHFNIKDTDEKYLNVIDQVSQELDAKYQQLTGEYVKYELSKVDEYLIFSNLLELSKLLTNMEFDSEDNVFNLFVDKKFPYKIFRQMFKKYNIKMLYPIRPIVDDYLFISNKNNYVNILVDHLSNNFKEQVNIYKKRRISRAKEKAKHQANNLRESSGSIYSEKGDGVESKKSGGIADEVIKEDLYEDSSDQGQFMGGINKFFCGLNPFK